MPLQDSFGKKSTKPADAVKANRAKNLSKSPSVDDLMESLRFVQETMRQPLVLTWKRADGMMYLLSVIRNSEDYQPTWILHEDHGDSLAALWTYTTSDTELIYNMLGQQVPEPGAPAAVIPESLRPKAPEAKPGQPQFFENYEIIDTIGHGGMGIIYKAKDRNDGNYVALKVLRADLMVDPSNVERFKHEASAVRQLQHNNLIGLREFGLSRFGQPFLAMEYLEGVELKAVLQAQDHLDAPAFVNVFTQLCEALAYAHERGLVHRDLKPNNIMLVKSPNGLDTVKIIDFGIAKSVSEKPTNSLTTYGQFLGSPAYMSPEQCGGAVLDSRSDIYSLGCVMYEAITGVLPFKHDNILKTILAQVNEAPALFSMVRPDLAIPGALEDIIFKSLQKDPDDRYQSARELCEDLWAFAGGGTAPAAQSRNSGAHDVVPASPAALSRSSGAHDVVPASPASPLARVIKSSPSIRTPSAYMPAYKAQPGQQGPRIPHRPPPPPMPMPMRPPAPVEQNLLSDQAYMLLRYAGILDDDVVQALRDCLQVLESGDMTFEQAVAIIQHARRQQTS